MSLVHRFAWGFVPLRLAVVLLLFAAPCAYGAVEDSDETTAEENAAAAKAESEPAATSSSDKPPELGSDTLCRASP